MKTILVDAINTFILSENEIFEEMYQLLEKYPNRKIILTGAKEDVMEKFRFNKLPYEFFTLRHDPEKTEPKYYTTMLKHFKLKAENVIYFEHNQDAVKSAESVGIKTFFYDKDKKDLGALKKFIDESL